MEEFTQNGKKLILYPAVQNPQPRAVCIYCVDPRFALAFDGFIVKELGFKEGEFVEMMIAGGPAPLAHPDDMKSRCRYLIRQTMFSCNHFPIKRIVLIGHEDCGYYEELVPQNGNPSSTREKDDLPIAAKLLNLMVPEKVVVEVHYAFFADKERTQIAFENIPISFA